MCRYTLQVEIDVNIKCNASVPTDKTYTTNIYNYVRYYSDLYVLTRDQCSRFLALRYLQVRVKRRRSWDSHPMNYIALHSWRRPVSCIYLHDLVWWSML